MPPFSPGEGLLLPFSLREKGPGDEGRLSSNNNAPECVDGAFNRRFRVNQHVLMLD